MVVVVGSPKTIICQIAVSVGVATTVVVADVNDVVYSVVLVSVYVAVQEKAASDRTLNLML